MTRKTRKQLTSQRSSLEGIPLAGSRSWGSRLAPR